MYIYSLLHIRTNEINKKKIHVIFIILFNKSVITFIIQQINIKKKNNKISFKIYSHFQAYSKFLSGHSDIYACVWMCVPACQIIAFGHLLIEINQVLCTDIN